MNLWKDRRVDSLHRVVLPREAFSLLGWMSDEVLEAEALPAQDALLLRAQNHPRPQCCACEPSSAAEPAPLPRLYLPSVQRDMPPMAAEYTPAEPAATPEPDVELPLGDASQ